MPSLPPFMLQAIVVFLLVLTRVSGLVMTAPLFGTRGAPMRVRGLLAAALALMLTPVQLTSSLPEPTSLIQLVTMLAREAMLGLALGLAVLTVTGAVQMAGQLISQIAGLSLADVFDPTLDANVSMVGQLLDSLALAAFFCVGGHRYVLSALLESFRWQPPGAGHFPPGLADALQEIVGRSFAVGVRIAAPALAALLLAVLVTGLISRALPQLNLLAIGFNINIPVMLGVMALSLGSVSWIFQEEVVHAVDQVAGAMRQPAEPAPDDTFQRGLVRNVSPP